MVAGSEAGYCAMVVVGVRQALLGLQFRAASLRGGEFYCSAALIACYLDIVLY